MTESVTLLTIVPTATSSALDDVFSGPFGVLIRILLILVIAIVLRVALHFVIQRVVNRIVSGVKKRQNVKDTQALSSSPLAAVRVVQRTRTLGTVLNNVVTVVVVVVALLLIVTAIDPTILGSFAIITAALGAGLGFGAQNIVKDVLNGLFMVAEDQLGVGDVVDLGPAVGVVEAVGIRITRIRSVDGTAWFVRNGEILRVGNMSLGWSRAIIDLAIPYTADVDAVQSAMLGAAVDMSTSSTWRSRIIEKPEIWGLESISAEALIVRLVVKTRTSAKDDVARELRLRLKRALDTLGVDLPPLNSVVFHGVKTGQLPTAPTDALPSAAVVDRHASAAAPAATVEEEKAPGKSVGVRRATMATGSTAVRESADGSASGATPPKRTPIKTRPLLRQDPRSTRIDQSGRPENEGNQTRDSQ